MKRHHREDSASRSKKARAPSISDEEGTNGCINSPKKYKSPPRKALLRRPSREDRSVDKYDQQGSRQTFLLRPNPAAKFVSSNNSSRSFNPHSDYSSSRKSYAPSSDRLSSHSSKSLVNSSSRVNPMLAASLASSGKLPNLPIPLGSKRGSSATVAAVAAAAMNAAAMAAALGAGGVISSKQMSHITKALASATRTGRDHHGSSSHRPPRSSSDRYTGEDSRSHRRKTTSKEKDMLSIFNARYARPVEHRNPEDDPNATRTLFLGNLPPDVEEPELRKLFERYGIIEDIDIKRRELETGATAFAFVRYLSLDMAHRAKVNLSGQMIGEYRFKIGYGKVIPTRCLWVGGLGPWTNYPEFATLVNSISAPEKIIWPSGKNYAHILYSDSESAAVAADLLRGYPLGKSHKRIRVDFTDESHMFRDPNWKRLKRNSSTESSPRHYSSRRSLTPRIKREDSFSDNAYSRDNHYSKYKRDRKTYADSDRSHSASSNHRRESGHRSRKATHERAPKRSLRDHSLSPDADSTRFVSRSPSSSKSRRYSSSSSRSPTLETSTNVEQLASCLPSAWDGAFYLKSSSFQCRMHILRGDKSLVDQFMYQGSNSEASAHSNETRHAGKKSNKDKHTSLDDIDSSESQDDAHGSAKSSCTNKEQVVCLRITQRMRLDPVKLDDVNQRIQTAGSSGFCILLAVPPHSVLCSEVGDGDKQPQRPLRNLIGYLRAKDSAGVVLLNPGGQNSNDSSSPLTAETTSGVLYAFPPCDFALNLLRESAPQLEKDYGKDDYLAIILIRGAGVV
ncbi:unnamed protein product [Schistosoma bovis]|uniref:RNA-binding protein 15 n=1 Tax=Schistosoma bovis TaxID=6184 RepID=A0A430QS27_SCHBO|nr:RNA-binding protein 15 [Schistosoma bovis]CAH8573440.1 unnamed protein product [Schistosoma bovis]